MKLSARLSAFPLYTAGANQDSPWDITETAEGDLSDQTTVPYRLAFGPALPSLCSVPQGFRPHFCLLYRSSQCSSVSLVGLIGPEPPPFPGYRTLPGSQTGPRKSHGFPLLAHFPETLTSSIPLTSPPKQCD